MGQHGGLGVDGLASSSWLEIVSTLSTSGVGGIVFDGNDPKRLKFVALDVPGQRVLVGHVVGGTFVVDAVGRADAGRPDTDYTLGLTIKGTSVSVTVDGTFALSFAFNSPVADGAVGVLARGGTTSVDSFTVRTNDAAFAGVPRVSIGDASVPKARPARGATATLTLTLSQAAATATSVAWSTVAASGVAGADFVAASGIATFAAGATTAQISVAIIGDAGAEPDELFHVALASPAGLTIADDAGRVTIVNDDGTPVKPTVTLAATDAAGAEQAQNPLVFTLTRTGSTAGALTVALTWGGAATYGADYTVSVAGGTLGAGGTSITLADGVASATITIVPVDDAAVESAETVTLTVAAGDAYTVGSPASASGSIADNDVAAPTLTIADVSVTEGNNGTRTVTLTVRLSSASATPVTVSYATANGTATAGSDYVAKSGTLTFAAGVTTQTFTITINGDRTAEPDETFGVTLSNPTGGAALGSPSAATVTIVNDDGAVPRTVSIAGTSVAEGNSGSQHRDAHADAVGARRRRRDGGVGDVERDGDGGLGLHGGVRAS